MAFWVVDGCDWVFFLLELESGGNWRCKVS